MTVRAAAGSANLMVADLPVAGCHRVTRRKLDRRNFHRPVAVARAIVAFRCRQGLALGAHRRPQRPMVDSSTALRRRRTGSP